MNEQLTRQLERQIERAHERGDQAELARLQFAYAVKDATRVWRSADGVWHAEYPDSDARARVWQGRGTAVVGWRSGSSGSAVSHKPAAPPVLSGVREIVLDAAAKRSIMAAGLGAWAESAGGLWGVVEDGVAHVLSAHEAVERESAWSHGCSMDFALVDRLTAGMADTELRWLGTWHSEPQATVGPAEPSRTDVEHWRSVARYLGRPAVGVIARRKHASDEAWLWPQLTGFVVDAAGPHRVVPVIEPSSGD